ncbi:MAG: SRPBCC family protein [Armatimonadota bacterium]|nr:SRPBCC family protein [Armatimonadota bacterium]
MNKGVTLIGSIGLGAGLMYMLDPNKGRRRRALMRDQLVHAAHKAEDFLDVSTRDLNNRAHGLMAQANSRVMSKVMKKEVSDDVLVQRVRAKMGRIVSHPHAITVTADHGHVILNGSVLAEEYEALVDCVTSVPGVMSVENQLAVHDQAGDISSLQGGSPRPGARPDLLQNNWSPATRLIVSATGGMLAFYGARRRGIFGTAAGAAGLGMMARGLTNMEMKRLIGTDAGHRAIDVQKTINIAAPVDQVFDFWTHYDNFPHFMPHVREVRDLGEGRSHWVVAGPAGALVEWDAVITRFVQNQILAWQSEPGSPIENSGVIHFDSNPDGSTRVTIQLSYRPPAGAIGHAVAALFGADPKHEMDQDLVRLKSLLELGRTRGHGGMVTREELNGGPPERVSEEANS